MSPPNNQRARDFPAVDTRENGDSPPAALTRLAIAQRSHAGGALTLAERLYREALDLDPRLAEAVYALGRIALQRQATSDACDLAQRAVSLDPDNPAYRRALGDALLAEGRRNEAIESYRAAIALKPDYDDVFLTLGGLYLQAGQNDKAAAAFESAARIRPERAVAHGRLADALKALGAREEAAEAARRAIAREPRIAQHRVRLGLCLEELGDDEGAVSAFGDATELANASAEIHLHHARALSTLGRYEDAVRSLEEAAAHDTVNGTVAARVLCAEGEVLRRSGRLDDARQAFERAIAADGTNMAARLGLARLLLASGDSTAGFACMERRLDGRPPLHDSPLWDGLARPGLKLLLIDEGRPSDTIFMLRHLPALAAEGIEVTLAIEPRYHALLTHASGLTSLVARESETVCDAHLPTMSLGHRRGLGPALSASTHLRSDPKRHAHWAERLGPKRGLRVGIHWRWDGDAAGHRRAVPSSHLTPLLSLDGVQFVNLNRGLRLAAATDFGPGLDADGAFVDTAAIMTNLDIVLTVDGAVAHVAAALGRTTWIMLSDDADWRWGLGRTHCPLHPEVHLFRQRSHGDWDHLIARVESALAERTYAT